jgi:hypothetical protein
MDILASILAGLSTVDGINPYWKLSLVFKCLTDTIMLDDFKTELKRLGFARMEREEAKRKSIALATKASFAGRHEEIENVRPMNGAIDDGPDNVSLGEMLTSDDQIPNYQDRRKSATKQVLGKAGTKISRLPSLGQNNHHNDPWIKNEEKD